MSVPWGKVGFVKTAFCVSILASVIVILYVTPFLVSSSLLLTSVKPAVLKPPDFSRLQQLHHQRRTTLQNACGHKVPDYNLPRNRHRFFSFSDRYRLVYCSIQKVGTGFWLRVMKLLNGQISRGKFFRGSFRHSVGIRGRYSFVNKSRSRIEKLLRSYKTFMFIRDPYARLFSAFMDKIFLPNHRVRTVVERSGLMDVKEDEHFGKCILNVTFEVFLKVVAQGSWKDPHWSPMHSHCNPCSVTVNYIGKMETFMADTEFILSQIGESLYSLTADTNYFESRSDLTFLVDLAAEVFDYTKRHNCTSDTYLCQVFQKLWTVLQTRGLLSKYIPYPFPRNHCDGLSKWDLLQRLVDIYHSQPGTRAERMSQRKEAMMEAYSALPRWLLKKVERYVDVDCRMFDYDCSIDTRFPVHSSGSVQKQYFTQFR